MRTFQQVNDRLQKLRDKDAQAYHQLAGMVGDIEKIYTGGLDKCNTNVSNTLKNLDRYLDKALQPKF